MLSGLKARIASALEGMTGATAKFAELDVRLDELTQLAHRASSETSLYSKALETVRLHQQAQAEEARRVTALVESQVLRVAKLESDWMDAFGRLDRLQDDISARQSELAGTMELLTQYQKMVAMRDDLLNERDRLLIRLQKAERPRALAADTARVHGPRLPFPTAILPAGKPPLIRIVDIGAQNLTEEEHIYQPLVEAGAAVIVGFEPLEGPAEERAAGDPSVTMLNHFVGDGGAHKFYINQYSPTSSLLPANLEFLDRFESLGTMCSPVEVIDVASTRLDDIAEVGDCDFLKIDVQGGELAVLRGATNVLAGTVAVHCEVEFSHVYKDRPFLAKSTRISAARGSNSSTSSMWATQP